MINEQQNLEELLNVITEKTKQELIRWIRSNPTTYYWDRETTKAKTRLIIQEVKSAQVREYIVILWDLQTNRAVLTYDSRERRQIRSVLIVLYEEIEKYVDKKDLDTFKDLLDI